MIVNRWKKNSTRQIFNQGYFHYLFSFHTKIFKGFSNIFFSHQPLLTNYNIAIRPKL